MSAVERNTTNLIKDIVFYYVKYYYDKHLNENNIVQIENCNVPGFIDNLYDNNSKKIKTYIRTSLKENQKEEYNSLVVENILLEMFDDIAYSKNRICQEIIQYQKNGKVRDDIRVTATATSSASP